MRTKIIFLFFLIFNLTGCAGSYTCNTYPTGKCQSVSKVYEKNKNKNYENRSDGEKEIQTGKMKTSKEVIQSTLLGSPILKEPKVLRVLLNYWEDDDKDLNMGGYIFVKVRDAEWELH